MAKVVLVVTIEEIIKGRTLEDETGMAIIEDLLVAQTLVLIMAIEEEDVQAMEGILLRKMLSIKSVSSSIIQLPLQENRQYMMENNCHKKRCMTNNLSVICHCH